MAHPQNLSELFNMLKTAAESFGFENKKDNKGNGLLRDCIHKDKNDIKAGFTPKPNKGKKDDNFWFGFVREDQRENEAYEGLSFVIFPERDKQNNVPIGGASKNTKDGAAIATEGAEAVAKENEIEDENQDGIEGGKEGEVVLNTPFPQPQYCVAAIGIGSSSLGADSELAGNPLFRRSFCSLINGVSHKCLFFKYKFDEIEQPTPGLQDYIDKLNYDDAMKATTAKYNTGKKGGLLPAAMVVDYTSEKGYALIVSWLAQYALWRNWASTNEGNEKKQGKPLDNIKNAISRCRVEATCLTADEVKDILLERRFIVLQGAPGCGKTWTAKQVAALQVKGKDIFKKTRFIQFHAETTYADFVYGIKPVLNGTSVAYEGNKGVLLEILDSAIEAEKDKKEEKYLLIIDEFNRANLANVLGPVFYLFEQNSGGNNLKLNLGKWQNPDKNNEIEELVYDHIPKNLYVIATMNTADKSLAVVDFALRRRFSWITLRPHKLDIKKYPDFDWKLFDEVNELFMKYATDEELNLQPGQSYFMDVSKRAENIKYGLMPLMKEYFNGGYLLPARDEFIQLFYRETGIFMYE